MLPRTLMKIISRTMAKAVHDPKVRSAGVIIIGDEILKGEVVDTNSTYIVRSLYKLGVRVKRVTILNEKLVGVKYINKLKISVIGDEIDVISSEVRRFSNQFTYVITSGGIGPTHDDVTFEAVAKAFNEPLAPHPVLVDICSRYYDTRDLNSPGMKLAHIPKSAQLTFGDEFKPGSNMYPNVSIKNVYMFPGIPQFLQRQFDKLGEKLFKSEQKFYQKVMYFNVTEKSIVHILNTLVKQFPDVIFGSYPELDNSLYKVRITMESTVEANTIAAYNKMLELMPKEFIVNKY